MIVPGAFHELRRSPRVALTIPIALRWEGERYRGSTFVVNNHGALAYAARNITVGDIFELIPALTEELEKK